MTSASNDDALVQDHVAGDAAEAAERQEQAEERGKKLHQSSACRLLLAVDSS